MLEKLALGPTLTAIRLFEFLKFISSEIGVQINDILFKVHSELSLTWEIANKILELKKARNYLKMLYSDLHMYSHVLLMFLNALANFSQSQIIVNLFHPKFNNSIYFCYFNLSCTS